MRGLVIPLVVLAGCFGEADPVNDTTGASAASSSESATSATTGSTGDATSSTTTADTGESSAAASTGSDSGSVDGSSETAATDSGGGVCECGYLPDWGNYACVASPIDPVECGWQPQMGDPCDSQSPPIDEVGCCTTFGEVAVCFDGIVDMWSCEDEIFPACEG